MRVSLVFLLLLGADFLAIAHRANATQSAAQSSAQSAAPPSATLPDAPQTVPTDPRALYEALNALRPDACATSLLDLMAATGDPQ